ncbi:DUF6578 domain-containing protein [Streptomyces niger]|uniref:DUF6578 domain-containing protein n=1 Tax=Streptomyces niger TaxID=66373 RepID=UPI00069AFBDB|nr:DUF6578 domain-containing protein [Streptomyces niger]
MSRREAASATNVPPPNPADDARPDDARPGEARREIRRVFYADWEMECCGTPFSVGDRVTWTLHRTESPDPMWEWEITNHGPDPADEDSVTGLVRSINVLIQGYRRPAGSRTYEEVAGERELRPVRTCPKWFSRVPGGTDDRPDHYVEESGALVELEIRSPDGRGGTAARQR